MPEPDSRADLSYSYSLFNLREGDLDANRAGLISPRQKRRLMLSFVLELIVVLPLGALLMGVMIGLSSMEVDPSKQWVVWVTDAIFLVPMPRR
jgi:hypothetical protein